MSKFPPKPKSGHLWESEVKGKPLYEVAPAFLSLGKMHGEHGQEGSYFVHNDVLRLITDYYLDLNQRCWLPYQALCVARNVKEACTECVNDPMRCICIHRCFDFLESSFEPLPAHPALTERKVA